MKLEFHASYKKVSQLLVPPKEQVPLSHFDTASSFEKTLGTEQGVEEEKHKQPQSVKIAASQDASLLFPAIRREKGPEMSMSSSIPELRTPTLELAPLPPSPEVKSDKTMATVNAPTLLGAKRLMNKVPMTGKSREVRIQEARGVIQSSSVKHGMDPVLGMAVANAESSFDPNAVSQDGHNSKGLFQLLDSTGQSFLKSLGLQSPYSPFDLKQNADIGMGYLRYLHDLFGKASEVSEGIVTSPAKDQFNLEKLAVAAFNAGQGRVASAQQRTKAQGGVPGLYKSVEPFLPETTRDYVSRVVLGKAEFESYF